MVLCYNQCDQCYATEQDQHQDADVPYSGERVSQRAASDHFLALRLCAHHDPVPIVLATHHDSLEQVTRKTKIER